MLVFRPRASTRCSSCAASSVAEARPAGSHGVRILPHVFIVAARLTAFRTFSVSHSGSLMFFKVGSGQSAHRKVEQGEKWIDNLKLRR
jgi:hypothetical protein